MWLHVTMAELVLRLWMRQTASIYGGYLRLHRITRRWQPISGGLTVWKLGEGITAPHRKKTACCGMLQRVSELDGFSATT